MRESYTGKERPTPQGSWKELVDERIRGYGGNYDALEIARNELSELTPENVEKIKKFQEALVEMDPAKFLKTLEELALLGEFNGDLSGTAFSDKPDGYKIYVEAARETIFEYIKQTRPQE